MTELKDLLDDMAGRARTYDVTERAIIGGHRRRRLVRTAAPASLAAAVAAVALLLNTAQTATPQPPGVSTSPTRPAAAPSTCEVHRLAFPPGDYQRGKPGPISPNGRYIVGSVCGASGYRQVIWDNNQPITLPTKGSDAYLTGVNDHGDAIGYAFVDVDNLIREAYWFHNGTRHALAGHDAVAWASTTMGPSSAPSTTDRRSGRHSLQHQYFCGYPKEPGPVRR